MTRISESQDLERTTSKTGWQRHFDQMLHAYGVSAVVAISLLSLLLLNGMWMASARRDNENAGRAREKIYADFIVRTQDEQNRQAEIVKGQEMILRCLERIERELKKRK